MVRAGFRLILDAEPDITVVAEAIDCRQAVELAHRHRPDVVLMDIRMPARRARGDKHLLADPAASSRVLVLTTFNLDSYVYDALHAGASGFLLKSASPEQLVHAIRVVAAGDALLDPAVTRRVISEYVRHPTGPEPSVLATLTDRDQEVVVELARGGSNAEIAARLYVSEATIKTHVARLLMKLQVRDRVQAVIWAYEHGVSDPASPGTISCRADPPRGLGLQPRRQPGRDRRYCPSRRPSVAASGASRAVPAVPGAPTAPDWAPVHSAGDRDMTLWPHHPQDGSEPAVDAPAQALESEQQPADRPRIDFSSAQDPAQSARMGQAGAHEALPRLLRGGRAGRPA